MKKIILFGGSFDPVHKGHIEILRYVHNHIGADKSVIIPARRSPLKQSSPVATNEQRLEMLKLAVKDVEGIEVSNIEFGLPEPSYSYHTVCHFKALYGDSTMLYWLSGADVIKELHHWYKINDMLAMCEMMLVCRGGYPLPDTSTLEHHFKPEIINILRKNMIQTPKIEISSTEIRETIKSNLSTSKMLDNAVTDYIRRNTLYK